MKNAAKEILQSSLGLELSQEEADVLSGLMNHREFTDGEYLITEGTTDQSLHVSAGGQVRGREERRSRGVDQHRGA